jgi:biotin transport system substrate-specific component
VTFTSIAGRGAVLADYVPKVYATEGLLIAGGALIVAASAQVVIPLPFTPVPITSSTFGVLLAAAVLGAARGPISMAFYLGLGAAGIPVFQQAHGGMAYVFGVTGGYVFGFIAAAALVGWLARRGLNRTPIGTIKAFVAGSLMIYAFGVPWARHRHAHHSR